MYTREQKKTDWHGAVVVRITNLAPHPDPETSLDVTRVFAVDGDPESGIPVVVRRGEFKDGDLAIYHGMDAVVPTTSPRFAFLDPKGRPHRLRARRLRGVFSEGLLTPACPLGQREVLSDLFAACEEGDDFTVFFGITKRLDPGDAEPVECEVDLTIPHFDLEARKERGAHDRLADRITAALTQQDGPAGDAWCWITRDLVAAAMRAGHCRVESPDLSLCMKSPNAALPDATKATIAVWPSKPRGPSRPGTYVPSVGSEKCAHDHHVPQYSVEALRKVGAGVFEDGECVVVREKIHGSNARTFHDGGRLWVGSRTQWKKRPEVPEKCAWWHATAKYSLEPKLAALPGLVLFYEIMPTQDLRYGVREGDVAIAVFDAMLAWDLQVQESSLDAVPDWWLDICMARDEQDNPWLEDAQLTTLCERLDLPMAPLAYRGPWKPQLLDLRNGPTLWPGADHTREGVVIRPMQERRVHHTHGGRCVLKVVGEDYKTR